MSTTITKAATWRLALPTSPSNFGISIMITSASRLSMATTIMYPMSILTLKVIWYSPVLEIKRSGFGRSVLDIARKLLMGIKDGLEDYPLPKMGRLLSVALMIKVLSFGISIKKPLF